MPRFISLGKGLGPKGKAGKRIIEEEGEEPEKEEPKEDKEEKPAKGKRTKEKKVE